MKLGKIIHHMSGHCWKGFQEHGVKGQGNTVMGKKNLLYSSARESVKGTEPKITEIPYSLL